MPRDSDPKRVYYMSMEFLMGRSLTNALNNLAVVNQYTEALREMGYNLEELVEQVRVRSGHGLHCVCRSSGGG